MNNFSEALWAHFKKCSLPLLQSFPHSLSRKSVFCSHTAVFVPALLISLIHPCVFVSSRPPLPSLSALSSICSSVICSKGLGVGYSEGRYGVWPQFSSQLLIYSHPALHCVWECAGSVCTVCVCLLLIILDDLPHLFLCRCLGTRRPQQRVWVSWISWVTLSQKRTTERRRYVLYSHKHTNMCVCCKQRQKQITGVEKIFGDCTQLVVY